MRAPILLAALLASSGVAAPPSPPRVGLVGQAAPPEVQAEYLRLERIADDWALGLLKKHGLLNAQCRIALDPGERSSCVLGLDGISLHVMKTDRAPSAALEAILSFSNHIEISGDRLAVVGGKWIGVGDVFEIEAGKVVYAHFCEAVGEADYVSAQCRWARDHSEIAGRATRPKSRFDFEATRAQRDIGAALRDGELRVLHNGSRIDLAPLIAAAQDFARQDFGQLARR